MPGQTELERRIEGVIAPRGSGRERSMYADCHPVPRLGIVNLRLSVRCGVGPHSFVVAAGEFVDGSV